MLGKTAIMKSCSDVQNEQESCKIETRNSKPTSSVYFGPFWKKFSAFFLWWLPGDYGTQNWGLGGRKGGLSQKNKIFHFFHIFHRRINFQRISLRFFLFPGNLKNPNYRSDFKINHMSEFLSDFAQSGV